MLHHRLFWKFIFPCGAILISLRTAAMEFRSPEQIAPGQVIFRLDAPAAKVVFVEGLRHRPPAPMSKDADGLWTATVSDLSPDIYTYTFNVDGVSMLDPRNRFIKRWTVSQSAVEVTGTEPTLYANLPVPHGTLHEHLIVSKAAGRELGLQVYTPPEYDARARKRYPVIVLCHGTGDDELSWTEMGRAHLIADNLIAKGKMEPAVVVMPYGHPRPRPLVVPDSYRNDNIAAMEQEVLTEVLPFVEKNYRVSRDADDRAIAGLSMGGGHALGIGLAHPEIFHWVGGFSASPPNGDLAAFFAPWAKSVKDKKHAPRLLWLAIGREDSLLARNETATAWLKNAGVPFQWKLTDGGHEWTLWREYWGEFAPLLFQKLSP